MAIWSINLSDGAPQTATGSEVKYDDERKIITQTTDPTTLNDVTNKKYADQHLVGIASDTPTDNGALMVLNAVDPDDKFWDDLNISSPIFNAIKLNSILIDTSTIVAGQALIYRDDPDEKFVAEDIVNNLNKSTAALESLIINVTDTAAGAVYLKDLSSSDGSVSIETILADGGDPNSAYLNLTTPGNAVRLFTDETDYTVAASTAEKNLAAFTVAANTLNTDGQKLVYTCGGNYQAITTGLTLRFKFNGLTIFTIPSTGLLGNSSSSWRAVFTIKRTDVDSIRSDILFTASDATSLTTNSFQFTKVEVGSPFDFTNDIIIKATGATGLSSSCVQFGAELELV